MKPTKMNVARTDQTILYMISGKSSLCVQRTVVNSGLVWAVTSIRGVSFHKQSLADLQKSVQGCSVPWTGPI